MNVTDALKARYSVRGYLPDPVPHETIVEVLEATRLAPSGTNTQPWHLAVVSGQARDRLAADLCALVDDGVAPNRDFPIPADSITGVYLDRRRDCGYRYYESMGVARDDRPARAALARKNFEFFGAPHAAFLSMPTVMGFSKALDLGIYLQTLMLVLVERGLGCIPQGALASYPDAVRAVVDIPAGNGILCGISFGYIDPDAHINTVRMPREPLEVTASFTS